MRLTLVDAEHAHDEDGELWIRDPVRWRRNDDPEPAEDAPALQVARTFAGWQTVRFPDGNTQLELAPYDAAGIRLVVEGQRYRGRWRILAETPSGRRYMEFWS